MGTPDKKLSEFVDKLRLWIPRRTESTKLSRDFWMPDQSCRVCYECDVQFTVFNRRHHCRICGRVFCAKCTANSIPVPCDELNSGGREVCDRVRVCSYCFTQWDQGVGGAAIKGTTDVEVSPGLSRSPSVMSFVSTKSSCTSDSSSGSTAGCTLYSTGPYQHVPHVSEDNRSLSFQMDLATAEKDKATSETNMECFVDANDTSFDHFGFSLNRRDDEDDDYGIHHPNPLSGHFFQDDNFYGKVTIKGMDHVCGPYQVQSRGDNIDSETKTASDYMNSRVVDEKKSLEEENAKGEESEPTVYDGQQPDVEPVEYDDNGLLWLPPEPEDKDDEREAVLLDEDDDDDNGGFTGEWGYLRPSNSLSSREYSSCDKSSEHRRAMKNAMEGHFRTLVSQLLQGENLPASEQEDQESWLNIVTSLSWEVATLLKPDTSKGGGMDPGGYVKVKCIASGSCNESMVVKGVVCKKNVAHRRMTTKLNKPRVLILGGALEYQRVSNHLSSFDTLLQQEKDHLKMAVAKIDAHHPNVLLVEKSVSRYAQEYLLEKNIKLVLNIKRPLLERIARCTGAQIVTSIDHLTSPKLGYCECFHVERFFEEHGSAGQGGKKLAKTLMYLEGCSKPLGCTILLKGARGDELKKVKHVVQYGVFAAYHMALETSFLADEGASFPDLPLKCPITLALPDKLPSTDRSISRVEINDTVKTLTSQSISEQSKYDMGLISDGESATDVDPIYKSESIDSTSSVNNPNTWNTLKETGASSVETTGSLSLGQGPLRSYHNGQLQEHAFAERNSVYQTAYTWDLTASTDYVAAEDDFGGNEVGTYNRSTSDLALAKDNSFSHNEDAILIKEEIPPLPLNSQGILVSVSKRCIWKGIVCEWAHRVRIKYYKSFDEPLGRFLRDQLFDQSYCCPSCDKPSEAHIYCYTHRQGSLTLSVKKLPDFLLPGERDNKIWMWHRCLRCPRTNSFPPGTRRVVMSDAAWGLSFGRFLEMSFSSHATASTVARCGHSLYRDCLRFYGLGRKVACFRYAYINVHSVYLPSAKLDFNYSTQVWIQKEANEISDRADSLFKEVETTLKGISDKAAGSGLEQTGIKAMRNQIMELENMLRKEKEEFKELFRKASKMGVKDGEPAIDILEINKLRRQILFHSYVWDQRLIYAVDSNNKSIREKLRSSPPKLKENFVDLTLPDKLVDIDDTQTPGIRLSSSDSVALENQPVSSINYERSDGHRDHTIRGGNSDLKASGSCLAFNVNFSDKCDLQESGSTVVKFSSEGQLHIVESFSDSVDATRTGEGNSASTMSKDHSLSSMPALGNSTIVDSIPLKLNLGSCAVDRGVHVPHPLSMTSPCKELENLESNASWRAMPFPDFYGSSSKKIILQPQKLNISDYSPIYLASFREREWLSGARLLLPVGVNETVIPVYDDEPTSIISYALVSADYHAQLSVLERGKDAENPSAPLPFHDSVNLNLSAASETYINFGSCDESILSSSGSRSSQSTDPLSFSTDLHARVSFTDDGPLGKSRYAVTCYYAKRFEALRRICCSSELDYIRSLSRCKKWGAQGGKSNVFFAKTLDDRFIIKQVTKTELESFLQFAPAYFKYLSGSFATGSPTCLAKILGIYQVSSKHLKGGKETKMDVLVMENLLFGRNISRLYDLKGSSRSRYNPDTSGSNKVLLDQNLIEAMPTSPIFVGNKAKRLLERAVWNDTSFLGAADVMDYSLLVGVDEERNELVVGIIDFIRQYTWDKHLESWVKTSGILGGPKNAPPTVISPQQYKKRFRKAMAAYFIMVLDQWSEPTVMPRGSDPCKETHRVGSST